MSKREIKAPGVAGGTLELSSVGDILSARICFGTVRDQGSRSVTNQGNIGNIATGDNHSVSASVGGPTSGTRDTDRLNQGGRVSL